MALTENWPDKISKRQFAFALFMVFLSLGIGEIVRSFSFGTSINISALFGGLAIIIYGLIFREFWG